MFQLKLISLIWPNYKNTKGGIFYNCISGWTLQPSQSKNTHTV